MSRPSQTPPSGGAPGPAPPRATASAAPGPGSPIEEDRVAELLFVSAGVAHEVLNPLGFSTLALFQLDELLARDDLPEDVRRDARRLIDSARAGLDRVQSVVSDLRDYALREQSPTPSLVDLHENLQRTVRLLALRRPEGVRFHVELGPDGRARCRPSRMNQVFFNLILNALQAVGASGEIWIQSRVEGDRLLVTVRDSGPGIPPEHLGRLFRPFFTTKDQGRNVGLGLALSFRIVRELGGDILVRSEPGRGAEFTVSLPRGV